MQTVLCLQILNECNNSGKGNPIACEYSTGGNLLHAILEHRRDVNVRPRRCFAYVIACPGTRAPVFGQPSNCAPGM